MYAFEKLQRYCEEVSVEDDALDIEEEASPTIAPSQHIQPTQRYNAALRYLARTQRMSGAWGDESSPEITAIVLLAFIYGGHTDRTGDYRPQLQRAVHWLTEHVQNAPSLPPIVALALDGLAKETGADEHANTRDAALAIATARDDIDQVCLAQLHNTTPPTQPVLPETACVQWAMALTIMLYAGEEIPEDIRTMLEQHQANSGANTGSVMLPDHSSTTPDTTTLAATAVLALVLSSSSTR
jgi:hypothetical protein